MNFRSARAPRGSVLDLTPLIDVIFQLLIFFLLTSSYVDQQQSASATVPVELPEASLEATASPAEELVLTIDEGGAIYLNEEQLSLDMLTTRLLQRAAQKPQTIVLIRGDERVPYGRIAQVMAIVQATGLSISAVLQSSP